MNPFQRRAAIRIAGVSLLLASIASTVFLFVARERSEKSIVSLAIEESRRLIEHYHATDLTGAGAARPARHESVTILFTDFRGFTPAVSSMPADRMVDS